MNGELSNAVRAGRSAVYWSWYCSMRRGGNGIGSRGWLGHNENSEWKIMRADPHQRFGVAGGNRGARRKVHMVRDQIIAKHKWHPEARMTRWLCGAYTFDGILQAEAVTVCSACLMKAQHRATEPNP